MCQCIWKARTQLRKHYHICLKLSSSERWATPRHHLPKNYRIDVKLFKKSIQVNFATKIISMVVNPTVMFITVTAILHSKIWKLLADGSSYSTSIYSTRSLWQKIRRNGKLTILDMLICSWWSTIFTLRNCYQDGVKDVKILRLC